LSARFATSILTRQTIFPTFYNADTTYAILILTIFTRNTTNQSSALGVRMIPHILKRKIFQRISTR